MKNDDRDDEFRIRPGKPKRAPNDESYAWNNALKQIMHFARMSRSTQRRKQTGTGLFRDRQFKQRCAVRVSYTPNRTPGRWKAHGRYLARESATPDQFVHGLGFGSVEGPRKIATTLDEWQKSGDERLFKLILSPEFGDRMDLEKLTRELMARMELDLGTRLQWIATVHDNTQFPHVHVALRGLRDDGRSLRLDRAYVQHGIRENAEDAATAQIGYRSELDAQEAQRREVDQKRYTSLDRILNRSNGAASTDGTSHFVFDLAQHRNKVQHYAIQARLLFLGAMGLAEHTGAKAWRIRCDFETVLRAMRRATDRQRALAAHTTFISDVRLQSCLTDVSKIEHLEGRVLGHGEEESTSRTYMLLEGTDHNVHFIYHSPEMERARRNGELSPDSFVHMSRSAAHEEKSRILIQDCGDSKRLLNNKEYFRKKAQALMSCGILPVETGLGGWLGKYEAALSKAVRTIQDKERELGDGRVPPSRGR